jgi:hypothetical protein
MENSINLKIDLPPDIIKKLENVIIETVTKTLHVYAKRSCQRFADYFTNSQSI